MTGVYERKTTRVEAEQYCVDREPKGLIKRLFDEGVARKGAADELVVAPERGPIFAVYPGEWVVAEGDSFLRSMSNAMFVATFEKASA